MLAATHKRWKPGVELPYIIPLAEGGMLAIALSPAWLKADSSGDPLLLPPAVRALDRLRAVFVEQRKLTPGFIISLREAMGQTQEGFGARVGVSKMTISRWECGRMRPSPAAANAIRKLQTTARHEGVRIDGEKGANKLSVATSRASGKRVRQS